MVYRGLCNIRVSCQSKHNEILSCWLTEQVKQVRQRAWHIYGQSSQATEISAHQGFPEEGNHKNEQKSTLHSEQQKLKHVLFGLVYHVMQVVSDKNAHRSSTNVTWSLLKYLLLRVTHLLSYKSSARTHTHSHTPVCEENSCTARAGSTQSWRIQHQWEGSGKKKKKPSYMQS